MTDYVAPLKTCSSCCKELAGLDEVAKLPGCEEVSAGDWSTRSWKRAAKFCGEVLDRR